MKKSTRNYAILLVLVILCVTFLELTTYHQTRALGNGWLDGWQYRKRHDIAGVNGAGTNYQIKIEAYYYGKFNAPNAALPSISGTGYLAENIVHDADTGLYWWIFEDRSSSPIIIRMAHASSLDGPWTVEVAPVISESGHNCVAPFIAKFGDYWYIYYGRKDTNAYISGDIWVQKSSSVNTGYSAVGIDNPILSRGSLGQWDDNRVDEPFVFLDGATYYLFYMGEDSSFTYEKTGYATSLSPSSGFAEYSANPVLPNGDHGWDSGLDKAADPFVFKYDDVFYVGVTASQSGKNRWQIGFYTTRDFMTFTHYDRNPILKRGTSGSWDNNAVLRGAINEFNGTLCFSYAGNDGTNFRCGKTILTIDNIDYGETVYLNSHSRTDFGDVRFTSADGSTPLDYWMETEQDGSHAVFWIKIPEDLTQMQTIYIYYGNSSAATTSNGANTFLFFDDFSSTLDKWITVSGTWSISNGMLTTEPPTGQAYWNNYLVTANPVGTDSIAIKAKMKAEQAGDTSAHPGLAWHANNLTGTSNRNDHVYFRPHQYGSSSWANVQPAYYDGNLEWYGGEFEGYFSWNTWYEIEARIPSSGNVKLYGSDVYWYDWDNQQYSYDHIGVAAHDMGKDYWDYVLVRKYADPEPVHGNWGSQETVQSIPPNFGSIDANTTIAGSPFQMSCAVNSTTSVSYYIYSWNNTGSWVNQTATPFTDFINSSAAYATFSDTWNTIAGHTVSVKIYANDTYNNWNASSQYNFAIASASASRLVFTTGAGQSLSANGLSSMITVQRQDQYGNPVTFGSLTASLGSTSAGATFYSDAGTTQASSVTINDGSSSVNFWYKDTVADSPTLNVSATGLSPATTAFLITSDNLNHFTITAIPNPQTAGTVFNIMITATDQYGNTVVSYTGSNILSDLSGTISPKSTSSFSKGVWNGSVTITKAYYNDTISTSTSENSGTTNSFNVHPSAFDHFTMSSYPSSTVTGQSFNITVIAWDVFGNGVTDYAGQVHFTSSDGQAVLPYTAGSKYAFTLEDNGSHTFTDFELNTVPFQTITVTDSVKSTTSNLIAVMLPITPPSYSSISVSATFAGQSCTFYSGWNDNYGLSGYIFSTNNTGLWQNTTWTPFSGTPSLASVTQNLNSNIGAVIGYNWYANNTNGLWNSTGIQTLTTTDSAPGLSFSVISNSTVSELVFNSTSQILEFTVSGPSGTVGLTNVTIAKTLVSDVSTLKVYLDGNEMNYTINDLTYYWLIHFTYHHSTHEVVLDFVSQQTITSATPLNGLPVAIIGLAIVIFTTLAITINRKTKFPNATKKFKPISRVLTCC